MSSDYLSRLRAELLRAGATQRTPRRRARVVRRWWRPLAAAVAAGLVVAMVVLTVPRERPDDIPAQRSGETVMLTYRVPTADPARVAQILRDRMSAAGLTATVTAGDHALTISAPKSERTDVTALTAPARFAIYDWERSVLGPDGRAAPTDSAVTGGAGAGQEAALTETKRSRAPPRRPAVKPSRPTAAGSHSRAAPRSRTQSSRARSPARTRLAAPRTSRSS
jgi:hypothetical protein